MYIPEYYEENDIIKLKSFIKQYPFGTVIASTNESVPVANHIPLFMTTGDTLKIQGHFTRTNDFWRHLKPEKQILIIFHGPHGYISPIWYETSDVPTWNYAVVQVYGKPRLITDEAKLQELVKHLTKMFEDKNEIPWDGNYNSNQLKHIVGFEVEVQAIKGKFKLSQNRSETDRRNVIHSLKTSVPYNNIALANFMEENY